MDRMKYLLGMLAIGCSLGLFVGNAQAVPFTNGSFEDGLNPGVTFETLSPGDTNITGWTVTAGTIDYIGGFWDASDGSRSIYMNGTSKGAISQAFDTTVGIKYNVQFDLAANAGGSGPVIKTLQVGAGGITADYTFDSTGKSNFNMGYQTENFLFTALGSTTTLVFSSLTGPDCRFGPVLDNVQVTAVSVPEPSVMILLGSGLMGLPTPETNRINFTKIIPDTITSIFSEGRVSRPSTLPIAAFSGFSFASPCRPTALQVAQPARP